MKAITGFIELVFIILMMAVSIPFITTLVIKCDDSKMHYMKDKTMYYLDEMGSTSDSFNTGSPIRIDYGGAQILALVNDDFCPDDAKVIRYDYNAKAINQHTTQTEVAGYVKDVGNDTEATLRITNGWKTEYVNAWSSQLGNSLKADTTEAAKNGCCLFWHYKDKCWVIADYDPANTINMYEDLR